MDITSARATRGRSAGPTRSVHAHVSSSANEIIDGGHEGVQQQRDEEDKDAPATYAGKNNGVSPLTLLMPGVAPSLPWLASLPSCEPRADRPCRPAALEGG